MRLLWLPLVLSLAERLYPVVREEDGKKIENSDSNVEMAQIEKHVHQHSASLRSDDALLEEVASDSNVQRGEDPVEEHNAEKDLECVNGTLKLKGTYQVHGKEGYHLLSGCHTVIGEDAKLELFAPLVFNSTSLEFQGNLTVVGKAPMAGSCLRVLGQVVVSGDFFVKDCQKQLFARMRGWHGSFIPDDFFDEPEDDVNNEVDDDEWEEESSLLEATDGCTDGGGIYALNLILQKSGKITIENCSSKRKGGAIYVEDSFIQEGGDMMIKHCRADKQGGAIYSKNNFRQDGGHLTIQNCTVSDDGGAIYVEGSFTQEGGETMIKHCQAGNTGGAIYVEDSFTQEGGDMMIKHCQAGHSGGGVYAEKNFTQNKGALRVEHCSARWNGGALLAGSFRQTEGGISLSSCRADHDGGGLSAEDFEQTGGSMSIQSCKAEREGGGLRIWKNNFRQDGELHIRTCRAQYGGALYFDSKNLQQWKFATALVEDCSAKQDGGGLYIGVATEQISILGHLEFRNCSAGGRGGGVFIEGKDGEFMSPRISFHHCKAKREGGAFFAERMTQLGHVTLDHCDSGGSGALTVYNDVNVSDLTVVSDADTKGQAITSGGAAVVESLNCTGSGEQMCEVASSTNLSLPKLWCPDGAERTGTDGAQKVACSPCGNGYVRLIQALNPQCQPCPPQAARCVPTNLTMPAGMTVDANNISVELYCPNPAACPGGYLLATSESKMSKEQVYQSMCYEGYVGDDCSKCAESHGKADYNPLTCLKCPTSPWRSMVFYVLKDLILFASAVASTLTASAEKKHSAVLLNQLLAFATVANIVTTGVMQTRLFASFHEDTRQVLQSLGLLANFAQAQADGGTSKDCLLRHFGFPTTLLYAHMFSAVFPLILIAALAVFKGPKLSLVLGVNVFLPGFTAAFGKYLIAFRCKPEGEGGNLLTPFLPEFSGAAVVIPFAIVLCFVLGVLGWWLAVRRETKAAPESSKEPEMPTYILFLTGSYKSEYRAWEIERLVRKMLLSLFTSTIPVSYSPALQMLVVSNILVVSMVLHYYFMPYKVDIWNHIEFSLLAVALPLTSLTTALIANDLHFARSKFTASCLIVFMISLLAAICGTMILLVVLNIYREWQSKRRQAAETATNTA